MNFLVGFILLVNGGNDKEAFWFFSALCKTTKYVPELPKMDGLRGLFKKDFPLL